MTRPVKIGLGFLAVVILLAALMIRPSDLAPFGSLFRKELTFQLPKDFEGRIFIVGVPNDLTVVRKNESDPIKIQTNGVGHVPFGTWINLNKQKLIATYRDGRRVAVTPISSESGGGDISVQAFGVGHFSENFSSSLRNEAKDLLKNE